MEAQWGSVFHHSTCLNQPQQHNIVTTVNTASNAIIRIITIITNQHHPKSHQHPEHRLFCTPVIKRTEVSDATMAFISILLETLMMNLKNFLHCCLSISAINLS